MARLQADYCPTRSPIEGIHVKGQDYFYYSDKDEKCLCCLVSALFSGTGASRTGAR